MPTYEYECLTTNDRFEKFQSIVDAALKKCPKCGGPVRRLIGTGSAVIFKGSGFYATDRRRGSRSATRCGRERPCCGRDVPCDSSPSND